MRSGKKFSPGAHADIPIYIGIAVLFLAAAWIIGRSMGPFAADPDYQYLMNALDILTFKVPNHFDHPGTPVQTIIAIILGLTWLVTLPWHGLSSVPDEVLGHPQFYLDCINIVFAIAIAAALVFFVSCMRKASGMITPALVGIFSIFSAYAVYQTFHRVMPEPVLFSAAMVLAGLLAQIAYARGEEPEKQLFAVAIGVLLGLCITAKVTSAPLLLAIFFLRSARARKTAFLGCVIATLIFLVPILPRLPIMLRGFVHILTHRGDYGSGSAGAPTISELLANVGALENVAPEIFLSVVLYLSVLLAARAVSRPLPPNLNRALWLCTAIIGAAILMAAKQPRALYLVPETAFMCLGNGIVASLLFRGLRFPFWARAVVLVSVVTPACAKQYHFAQLDAADAMSNLALMANAQRGDCLTVLYYGVNQTAFDLYFGNVSSGQKFSSRLARLYPSFVAYKTDVRNFQTFTGPLSSQAVSQRFSREKCVHMMGIRWSQGSDDFPYGLVPLTHSRGGLYLYALHPRRDDN